GRGDEVYPLEDFQAGYLLLVNAGIALPTAEVYANLPPRLTNPMAKAKMPLSLEAAYANTWSETSSLRLRNSLHNDLEISAFARHPLLGEIKKRLLDLGAWGVLMSGSGSTVFAIFDSEIARSGAMRDLIETGWWCAPAQTLSRRQYRAAISVIDS
ncbi:MAG: hypothetical protein J2P31_13655, partial [Blastocatellia bacterium]|nr:hypothetical protein [Blastocatellia bacterium]